jgi:LPS O-antigen subunit length determinant protein (WzzB/FepE family)
MLAKGDVEYAYKVVDRASPPKLRESPKRVLVVLLSVLIGAVLAVLVVIARSGLLKRSRVAS